LSSEIPQLGLSKIVSISEAASIAIHGIILIARSSVSLNVQQIADSTGTSKHHVAKIMQRLVKEGYLSSQRGPSGGFLLMKPANKITFLHLYESIEGKIEISKCPMDKKVCPFDKCLMDNISNRMTVEFREYLSKQNLAGYLE
jgi:Rrf2 family protein